MHVDEIWRRSEHDLLQDDSEAVDVGFLSSVDRSSCHTQQLRRRPQLVAVELQLVHLYTSHVVENALDHSLHMHAPVRTVALKMHSQERKNICNAEKLDIYSPTKHSQSVFFER